MPSTPPVTWRSSPASRLATRSGRSQGLPPRSGSKGVLASALREATRVSSSSFGNRMAPESELRATQPGAASQRSASEGSTAPWLLSRSCARMAMRSPRRPPVRVSASAMAHSSCSHSVPWPALPPAPSSVAGSSSAPGPGATGGTVPATAAP